MKKLTALALFTMMLAPTLGSAQCNTCPAPTCNTCAPVVEKVCMQPVCQTCKCCPVIRGFWG